MVHSTEKVKILVTTFPFGSLDSTPCRLLEGHDVEYNDVFRKLNADELKMRLLRARPNIIIAGTEPYTKEVLDLIPDLWLISRVGIGVDGIDLVECESRGIWVVNTPDAPSNAVAELTVCQMINMLRWVRYADANMRLGYWTRYIGRDLRECDVGVIGCGRIGRLVVEKLQGLKPRRIFVNDIIPERAVGLPRAEPESKAAIFAGCDVITLHIPYDEANHHYVSEREFRLMQDDATLINTSRGKIVDEVALYHWLREHGDAAAAIDVFAEEPYSGDLLDLSNAYLTPHLGSCTEKSRFDMEVGAVDAVLDFIERKELSNRVV